MAALRSALWLILGLAACLYAQDNRQRIVGVDSEIPAALRALYLSQGLAPPSSAGPWSEEELLAALDRIDSAALPAGMRGVYDFAAGALGRRRKALVPSLAINAEFYGHTNTEDFLTEDQYLRPWSLARQFIDASLEAFFASHVYILFNFSLSNSLYTGTVTDKAGRGPYAASGFFGAAGWGTNVFWNYQSLAEADAAWDWWNPFRTFIAVGGQGWSLQAGRDRLSWGSGESGNFLVGGHIRYHNVFRTAFYNEVFKYTFSVSAFENPLAVYNNDTGWNVAAPRASDHNNFFIAHRMEWRTLGGALNLSISEGLMYQPEKDPFVFDVLVLSPTICLHNLNHHMQNSIFVFEADWTPAKAWTLYAQMVLDDAAGPNENTPGLTETASPREMGWMLGAKTALPFKGGVFFASLEGVYTDPFLYLRNRNYAPQTAGVSGINFVVSNSSDYHGESFLGYRWGGDAVVFNANGEYRRFGQWSVKINIMYMIHGTHDKWTAYRNLTADENKSTPTSVHVTENHGDANTGDRNAPYRLASLSLSASGNGAFLFGRGAFENLAFYGEADLVIVKNPLNIESPRPAVDLQFVLGLSYTFR
ncbi:MAG: hypothetical protein LBQ61_06445 [Spirochaetales bacterium]|jgi:hypothetical protein|nr:hypothetical protein [Spirochaetales bacterium]